MQNYESNEPQITPEPPVKKDFLPAEPILISPDNPPWNSLAAVGVWLASVFFIAVVPFLTLLPYAFSKVALSNPSGMQELLKNDPKAILWSIAGIIPAHLLTFLLAWFVITGFNKKYDFKKVVGWEWNGFNIWTSVIVLGGFFILAGIVSYFVPEQENDLVRILKSSREAVFIVAFMATFTAPLVEEVVYRGILYSAFQRSVGVPAAVALVTFLFALVHVPQYWGSPSTILLLTVLSLILTLIRVRTKNLLPCVALHTLFNGIQSALLIAQPYLEKTAENNQPPTAFFYQFFK